MLLLVWCLLFAQAQENPFNPATDAEAGARLYRANCAICHGLDGTGGRGTDLTTGRYRHGSTDEDLFKSIANGVRGTEMPGFSLEGRQTFQIIAFLRTLAERGGPAQTAAGDADRGRAVFEGKGGCLGCHIAGSRGSRLGPDLSDAGARWSRSQLLKAILAPNDRVASRYWYAQATGRDGRKFYGLRLNEDTFSVQILDSRENLVSLVKSEMSEYRILKKSVMPSYETSLSRGELDDLLAYLATLRN